MTRSSEFPDRGIYVGMPSKPAGCRGSEPISGMVVISCRDAYIVLSSAKNTPDGETINWSSHRDVRTRTRI